MIFGKKKEFPDKVYENIKKAERLPLVSVIIPTLPHRKELLARAIASVRHQTYPHIEIIIEEGGRNVQDARNIGVARSKGKYIAFMDDDDEFYPTKIEKQVEKMEADDEITLCLSWGDDERFGLDCKTIMPKPWWTFKELIAGFNICTTSAFMVRRSTFDAVGGMDDTLDDSHEYDLAIKLSTMGKVYCIQESLCLFHQCEDNWSDCWDKKFKGMIQFMQKWGFAFDLTRWRNTFICLFLFGVAYCTSWKQPHPVHKIFNMTKERRERLDKEAGEYEKA